MVRRALLKLARKRIMMVVVGKHNQFGIANTVKKMLNAIPLYYQYSQRDRTKVNRTIRNFTQY